jgi:hypothetical protein
MNMTNDYFTCGWQCGWPDMAASALFDCQMANCAECFQMP